MELYLMCKGELQYHGITNSQNINAAIWKNNFSKLNKFEVGEAYWKQKYAVNCVSHFKEPLQ